MVHHAVRARKRQRDQP